MLPGAATGELSWQHDARCTGSLQQVLLLTLCSSTSCHAIQHAWGSSGGATRCMTLLVNWEIFFFIIKPHYLCQPTSFSLGCCLESLATFAIAKLLVKMSQAKTGIEE